MGPPAVECRYGNWFSDASPTIYPTCKPIVCSYPKIQNGQLDTGDNVRYRTGQQASVECDEGYELRNGGGKIRCKEDGSWEAMGGQKEFPQCKGTIFVNMKQNVSSTTSITCHVRCRKSMPVPG